MHAPLDSPSPWFAQHAALIAAGDHALDVACGYGRHAKLLAARGVNVTAVDRDVAALTSLAEIAGITAECRDLEGASDSRAAWPYPPASFDAVVVCNYLWRPTLPSLLATVRPGGILLYETFLEGNQRYGKPSRPDFLLREGELPALVKEQFQVTDYFEGDVRTALHGDVIARKAMIAARRVSK